MRRARLAVLALYVESRWNHAVFNSGRFNLVKTLTQYVGGMFYSR